LKQNGKVQISKIFKSGSGFDDFTTIYPQLNKREGAVLSYAGLEPFVFGRCQCDAARFSAGNSCPDCILTLQKSTLQRQGRSITNFSSGTSFPMRVFYPIQRFVGRGESRRTVPFYEAIGYHPPQPHNSDHLGLQLDAFAFLCAAEADAWEDEQAGQARRMQICSCVCCRNICYAG
jgi:hypothetical protein